MKALVLYRSYHGNTKQVADKIAKELATKGVESAVQDLRMMA
jgi:menaquinone-dependent protoporphyrinogen IX oxidase